MEKRIDKVIYDLYVDGGHRDLKTVYAFAVYNQDKLLFYKSDSIPIHKFWQVGGELMAVLGGLQTLINHNIKNVKVCYDYTGIYHWAVKEWKAKNMLTLNYQNQMQEYLKSLNISWKKIKAHSNNKKNNFVDNLVKQALNNNFYYFNKIEKHTHV